MKTLEWIHLFFKMIIVGEACIYFSPDLLFGCSSKGWIDSEELSKLVSTLLMIKLPICQ